MRFLVFCHIQTVTLMDAHNRGSQRYEIISIYASGPCDPQPEASNCCKNPDPDSFFSNLCICMTSQGISLIWRHFLQIYGIHVACMHASTARLDVHMLFSVNYHLMVYIVSPLEILLFAANKKLRNISCLRSVQQASSGSCDPAASFWSRTRWWHWRLSMTAATLLFWSPGFELLCNFLYLLSVLWLDSLTSLLLVWFYF